MSPQRTLAPFTLTAGRLASLTVLSIVLTLGAAACGSSRAPARAPGPSPEAKWAGQVCTDITNWKTAITEAADSAGKSLQSPGLGTVAELQADLKSAETATKQLVTNLNSLRPVDTPQGKRAQQQIHALSAQIQGTVLKARGAVAGIPAGAGVLEVASQLISLAPTLATLATTASTTLDTIKSGASTLQKGFNEAQACKPYSRSAG